MKRDSGQVCSQNMTMLVKHQNIEFKISKSTHDRGLQLHLSYDHRPHLPPRHPRQPAFGHVAQRQCLCRAHGFGGHVRGGFATRRQCKRTQEVP